MKNRLSRWLAILGYKLGIYKFSAKYFANSPKLTQMFNKGLPIAMVAAVVFGLGILGWQIAGLARDGEVHLVAVNDGKPVESNFEAKVVFKASQDRQPFNIRVFLDGRVISSKVGSAIEKDQVREYKFASGVGGENLFNVNLLSPGRHVLRVEAKTGSTVGEGVDIADHSTGFDVKNVKNLAAMGEPAKTFTVNQLPGAAGPRSSVVPLPGLTQKLSSTIFPKAKAHSNGDSVCVLTGKTGCRHGGLDVFTKKANGEPVAGIQITVSHPVLHACDGGNTRVTNGAGEANFRNCGVSNRGEDSARWTVTIQTPTPAGLTLPVDHSPLVDVFHNQNRDFSFIYHPSATADPGTGGAPAPPEPSGPAAPAPVYNYTPHDHTPLIALTGLTATSATVDAFGMKMADNTVISQLAKVSASIDGVGEVASITSFAPPAGIYASQSGLVLPLPDLAGLVTAASGEKTLTLTATNANGKSSSVDVKIAPPGSAGGGAPTATGNSPQPSTTDNPHKGSISVTVYAHGQAGVEVKEATDAKVGAVNITATNIGDNVRQCGSGQTGVTNNDQNNKEEFGRIKFTDCPAALNNADNHAKKYRITATIPDGFNKPAGKTVVEREITVKKDEDRKVRIVLIGSNINTFDSTPATGGAVGPAEPPTSSTPFPETGPNASGIMMLSNDQGRYDRAMIAVDVRKGPTIGGIPNTQASCGNIKLNDQPNDWIVVNFDASNKRKIRCSTSSFFVYFFKPGQALNERGPNENPRIAASITANHCTYVKKGKVTRIAALNNDGQCPEQSELDTQPNRLGTEITARYSPHPILIGQSYIYEHELNMAKGEFFGHDIGLSPVECAGDIAISHIPDPANIGPRSYPLRYWYDAEARKGMCTFKQQVSATFSAGLPPINEQLKLVFSGNTYLKPSEKTINHTRVRP